VVTYDLSKPIYKVTCHYRFPLTKICDFWLRASDGRRQVKSASDGVEYVWRMSRVVDHSLVDRPLSHKILLSYGEVHSCRDDNGTA